MQTTKKATPLPACVHMFGLYDYYIRHRERVALTHTRSKRMRVRVRRCTIAQLLKNAASRPNAPLCVCLNSATQICIYHTYDIDVYCFVTDTTPSSHMQIMMIGSVWVRNQRRVLIATTAEAVERNYHIVGVFSKTGRWRLRGDVRESLRMHRGIGHDFGQLEADRID